MEPIGKFVEAIVARVIHAQKGPTGISRRSVFREETSAADPCAVSESPDEPAMGKTVSTSFCGVEDGADVFSSAG